MEINILGVNFQLYSISDSFIKYPKAFTECYYSSENEPIHKNVDVFIYEGTTRSKPVLQEAGVHFSKNLEYWNFNAQIHSNSEDEVSGTWPDKGLWLQFYKKEFILKIEVVDGYDPLMAGEGIYHALRNLALYLRQGAYGNLFHGCSVELNGKAIIFAGHSSAGKTTLMTESILHHHAFPISNDRCLITSDSHPKILSWPGYISYCEGTLMNYATLSSGVTLYENGPYQYKTQSWPYPLKPIFIKTKDSKRIFPMDWLTVCTGKKYIKSSTLNAIVLSNVSPENTDTLCIRKNMKVPGIREEIKKEFEQLVFDAHEDAFLPWHGLSLPDGTPRLDDLIDRLILADVSVWEFRVSPSNLDSISILFEKIFHPAFA
ncbi:MAG: hypothetical protein ACJ75B_07075 [Flavisolibacter sp.]